MDYPVTRIVCAVMRTMSINVLGIEEEIAMSNNVSRRDFLRKAGKGILGVGVAAALPLSVSQAEEGTTEAPAWPWKWEELDPQVAMENGYKAFYTHGGCCAGTAAAIVETLAGQYGYPYNQINAKMFADGAGGYGAQSLCGSLGGACAMFGLFLEGPDANALRNELYAWYKEHAFPQYQPEIESITTVANSIECRDSVGKYMAATGYTMADDGRKARCAAVTGEVAAKAADLLNIKFGYYTEPKVVSVTAPAEEEQLGPNEYIGEGDGFGGKIRVKVTMDGDKIAKIDVLSHSESAGISDPAFEKIPQAIIDAGTTEIDTVSGATYSSKGLIAAVNDALSKVGK